MLRQKRVWRIRKKVKGTSECPRLCVHFSNKHITAQAIDDDSAKTIMSLSTTTKDLRKKGLTANVQSAGELGRLFGEKAKKTGLSQVVFDRNGRLYHGAVKAFADASRKEGLEF